MPQPALRYIIAATPRSGSNLLCEGLGACGIAGHPAEIFAPDYREPWHAAWGVASTAGFGAYFDAAISYGTGANGVYGMKIHWRDVPTISSEAGIDDGNGGGGLLRLFPDARYINIVRDDRISQALSWYRAVATGQWWRTATMAVEPAPPIPQAEEVLRLAADIGRQQEAWEAFFERNRVQVTTVRYAELIGDFDRTISRTLSFLGLETPLDFRQPLPRIERQADDVTIGWREALAALDLSAKEMSDHAS